MLKFRFDVKSSLHSSVLDCATHADPSIRISALDIVSKLVSRLNMVSVTQKLVAHVEGESVAAHRNILIDRILAMGKFNLYERITNFEWYLDVILKLSLLSGKKSDNWFERDLKSFIDKRNEDEIAFQLVDSCARIPEIRPFAVRKAVQILNRFYILLEHYFEFSLAFVPLVRGKRKAIGWWSLALCHCLDPRRVP